MADIEALRSKVKTLLELALGELDGDPFTLVIHLEEAVKTAEELEAAIMEPEEDAAEDVLVEPEDVAALIRETFETLKGLERLDIESLSAWTVTGISLFLHGRLPKFSVLVDEARRVLVKRGSPDLRRQHHSCGPGDGHEPPNGAHALEALWAKRVGVQLRSGCS